MNDTRTRICSSSMRARLEDVAGEWPRALKDAARHRAARLHEPALLVMVAATDGRGRRSLQSYVVTAPTGAPLALVVGDHPACDVSGVFGACLRHLVIWVDSANTPGWVHAVDLNTPDGLLVDGEQGIRRVDARCSVRIAAGSADLLAMALVPGENVDVRMIDAFAAPFIPRAPVDASRLPVTPSRAGAASRARPDEGRITREGVTAVGIAVDHAQSKADRTLRLNPTAQDLERGFLLGRYERCTGRLDDDLVSRVHALLVAHGDDVLVIDAGSTNGTDVLRDGHQRQDSTLALGIVRRAAVVARGFRLSLGGTLVEIR